MTMVIVVINNNILKLQVIPKVDYNNVTKDCHSVSQAKMSEL